MEGVFGEANNHTGYDFNRMARIFSSYDDGFKLVMAAKYGEYMTRTSGVVTVEGMNIQDGIAMAMGVPLAAQNSIWDTLDFEKKNKEANEAIVKEIQELSRVASRKVRDGDWEAHKEIMEDIGILMKGLPNHMKVRARSAIGDGPNSLVDSLADKLLKQGKIDLAERVRKENE
jgi:hypothetical protein